MQVESVRPFLLELIEKQSRFTEVEACKIKCLVSNKIGPKLIFTAVKLGNANVVQYLLSQGVSPNCSVMGSNPLFEAVRKGRIDLVKILVIEGKANPNQQIRGGDTPAIKLYRSLDFDLTTYVFAISNLNIKDCSGNPVLFYLEAQRPKHLKKLRELALSRTSIKTAGLVYAKINEKYLAHVWKIGGFSFSNEKAAPFNPIVTELEGFCSPYIQKKISESLIEYSHRTNMQEICFKSLIQAFKITNSLRYCHQTRLGFYKKNDFVLLAGGYRGHYSLFFIFKNLFIHLDRSGRLPNGLDIFSFNPQKLNKDILTQIAELKVQTEIESNKRFQKIHNSLDFYKGNFERTLEIHLKQPLQEAGTCAFDNSEGAVFLFLALLELEKNSKSAHFWFRVRLLTRLISPVRATYENWLAFHRERALRNYHLTVRAPEYPNTASENLLEKINRKFLELVPKYLGRKRTREYNDTQLINRLKKRIA